MTVSKNATISLYEVRCPDCHRKLMRMREVDKQKPVSEILIDEKATMYLAETRCPSCKVYVGIKV